MEILIVECLALFIVGVYGLSTKKSIIKSLISLIICMESAHLLLMSVGYLTKSIIPQGMLITSMVISGCTIGVITSMMYKLIKEDRISGEWWK